MIISGLEKCSFVDYPGKLAAVVFLKGCNMNCTYCHNQELLFNKPDLPEIEEEGILNFLAKRKNLLDAVVVTGGEPTLNQELPRFIRKVRNLGYLVKLDTNGTNPGMVDQLLRDGLLDFAAMDVKTELSQYNKLCRALVDTGAIVKTIKILMESDIDYEFRTTVYPGLTEDNLFRLAELLGGAKKWVLQHYSPEGNSLLDLLGPDESPEKPDLQKLASVFNRYTGECSVRGKEIPLKLKNWRAAPAGDATDSSALDVPQLLS